ncbi:hypothetical protein [Lunatimonas salinarum]|uniref:hypothetical protein n=1 Tax=Lunatimonas salinarum TaxID=1774590 RepID=UPI001ADF9F07|nr:hypothetical protein [Lunatimonas salinarum]
MTLLAYQTLFSIRIFHRFFLNLGTSRFEELDEFTRQKQLDLYDWRDLISWMPLGETGRVLRGHQIVLKSTNTHLKAIIRQNPTEMQVPFIPLAQETFFVFGMFYKDSFFEHYTEMPFLSEGGMVWCNNLVRFPLGNGQLPIATNEYTDLNEGIFADPSTIRNLCAQLRIVLPTGCKGLLVLTMEGQSGDFNILNANGTLKQHPTTFYLNFNNRSTYWRYLQAETAFSAETLAVKPLTRDGFVSIDLESDFAGNPQWPVDPPVPNPDIRLLKWEGEKVVSEIYL